MISAIPLIPMPPMPTEVDGADIERELPHAPASPLRGAMRSAKVRQRRAAVRAPLGARLRRHVGEGPGVGHQPGEQPGHRVRGSKRSRCGIRMAAPAPASAFALAVWWSSAAFGSGTRIVRPPDAGELGDRGGARARDHQVGARHALGDIGEEGLAGGRHPVAAIGRGDALAIRRAALLADLQAPAQRGGQGRDRGRHDLAEDAGALAAADDQESERALALGAAVGALAAPADRLADGIPGDGEPGGGCR